MDRNREFWRVQLPYDTGIPSRKLLYCPFPPWHSKPWSYRASPYQALLLCDSDTHPSSGEQSALGSFPQPQVTTEQTLPDACLPILEDLEPLQSVLDYTGTDHHEEGQVNSPGLRLLLEVP